MKKIFFSAFVITAAGYAFAQQRTNLPDLQKIQEIRENPEVYKQSGGVLNDEMVNPDSKQIREVHDNYTIYQNEIETVSLEEQLKALRLQANGNLDLYDQLKQDWIKRNQAQYDLLHANPVTNSQR